LALFERRPPERLDSSSLPASENLHMNRPIGHVSLGSAYIQ
jgi:hypothetical protein